MKTSHSGLQKALRVFAALLLVFSIVCFVLVAFTFVTSFFIGGQIVSDGTGIMRYLMRVNQHGKHAIDTELFGFAWLPGLSEVTLFLVYCCVLVTALRKRRTLGPAYPGARRYRVTLCVLAALTIVLPLCLWPISAPIVAKSGFFTQPMPTPVPGAILLACTLAGVVLAYKLPAAAPAEETPAAPAEDPVIQEAEDLHDRFQQNLNETEDDI